MPSMPQEPCTSCPFTDSFTGIVAYCPTIVVPSRATQISGSCPGLFGFRRYCHSQRRRLDSAASWPKTRRYSAATPRLSSDLYFVMSATSAPCQHVFHVADECVLRQRALPHPTRDRCGQLPYSRCDVQFLPHHPHAGLRDQAA